MLGVGAVVLSNSAKMLVVGIVLVFMHDEGHMMPRGCKENIFMLFLCRGRILGPFYVPSFQVFGMIDRLRPKPCPSDLENLRILYVCAPMSMWFPTRVPGYSTSNL